MQQPKKFGTFAGVFTPSILTILGVIMYLRLGWVVGESGLIYTLAIILIAHIISVTTGLSISSIATDKKIKTGGIYYILSRSLGLPMGGAIGLALFVATALSISLYLIGFTESFLSVPEISNFLNLDPGDKLSIQIVGSGIILVLIILAFISTSLVIKTQFFILGAIALSLISIFVGLFRNVEFHPQEVNLFSSGNGIDLALIFGVFFPAVTGFTAGVAMSGDLKDPKKSIPFGTLGSIITGFLVYVGLAIALAFFVDRDLLINDSNFLMTIAWFSPLVLAGIWGATLSSALGGILGGPRIMQAISQDKIGPKFLGKGYGKNNEPRNALILVFLIAEAGILLGDLNLVAGLVSMFYITAYGFINLAFALEQWASSDFRPKFKINTWFGIIGFVASFAVMSQLDIASMVGAIVIVMAIYFILKKKELQLDFGDVWQSVWSSIIRMSLHRMDSKSLEDRNWRPNIIMFSGSQTARQHLSDFGKNLVGKHGFLSIFDLEKKDKNTKDLKKQEQALDTEISRENQGIFNRREKFNNIYEGMELVSRTYGFSGVEPNTILLGWGRYSDDPDRFAKMIHNLSLQDHNLLMMDYDKQRGFGDHKRIDIWWRGTGNNGNLALQLVKFLWLSEDWREAELRLMIINPVNDEKELIHRNATSVLENLRMNAQIKIINNQIEKKSIFDIIHNESQNSSLTFMGIPPIVEGNEGAFVENINDLCRDIGTVVLIKASSRFKDLNIGVRERITTNKKYEELNLVIDDDLDISDLEFPDDPVLHTNVNTVWREYSEMVGTASNEYYNKLFSYQQELLDDIKEVYENAFKGLPDKTRKGIDYDLVITQALNSFIFKSRKVLDNFNSKSTEIEYDVILKTVQFIRDESKRIVDQVPQNIVLSYSKDKLELQEEDNFNLRLFKFQTKFHFLFSKKDYKYNLRYQKLLRSSFAKTENRILYELLNKWGQINLQYVIELQKAILNISRSFMEISSTTSKGGNYIEVKASSYQNSIDSLERIREINEASLIGITRLHLKKYSEDFGDLCKKLNVLNINQNIIPIRESLLRKEKSTVNMIPDLWKRNQNLLFNQALLELNLQSYNMKVANILRDTSNELQDVINKRILDGQKQLGTYLKDYLDNYKKGTIDEFIIDLPGFTRQDIQVAFESVIDDALRRIRLAGNIFPENVTVLQESSFNDFYTAQFNNPQTIDISVLRLIDYMIQNEFIGPMEEMVSNLSGKLKKSTSLAGDIIRIITYSTGNKEIEQVEGGLEEDEVIIKLLEEQYDILQNGIAQVEVYNTEISEMVSERIMSSYDLLSISTIMKSVADLKQYIKDQENNKRLVKVRSFFKRNYKAVQKQLSFFWYRQSKGILLANRLSRQENYDQTRVNDILKIYNQVSIKKQILHDVPFYYQQLFLRKEYYLNEFWVGREKELAEFNESCDHFKNGFKGAIMVLGERGCGKSFFTQYAINQSFTDSEVYTVSAPYAGSCKINDFKKAMQSVFETDNYESALDELPQNSIVIFDGIEQWWEKSKGGFVVVDQIMNIISRYGSKILFVLNSNIHSFRVMNSIRKIESHFLNLIHLESFNAEEIKDIIMLRHKSGNLRFELSDQRNRKMLSWDNAKLFSRYFNFSKGNIGVVLDAWIANIDEVEGDTLYIKPPKLPATDVLNNLENEWWLLLVQFVLHKRLHIKRLSRITMIGEKELVKKLDILKRAGVIIESSSDVYEINRFLYPHFRAKMIENEML